MLLARWLYLRALGLVTLVAVGSLWAQLNGLLGSDGIWPAADQLKQLHAAEGVGFFDVPTLAWISASDGFLHFLCAATVVLALLLIAGIFPRLVLGLLWLCWMSLVHVGGPFLAFQWDVLLIETLFFSIFFAPAGLRPRLADEKQPADWARFILQLLAFKLTFSSGVVKLASGDPSWRDLTALSYHYWTQPLPAWTSYLAHQWPMFVHQVACALMFVCELPLAALALGTRRMRLSSAAALFSLQVALAAAGNYSYFNLLAAVLCLPLLDDDAIRFVLQKWKWQGKEKLPIFTARPALTARRIGWAFAAIYAGLSLVLFFRGATTPLRPLLDVLRPFSTVNAYGAFAVMTKTRPEITLEGSLDGQSWAAWDFKYKPGKLDARPGFIAPYQPRLDWQMWFAALGNCQGNPWLVATQWKLLNGSPAVRGLFATEPFGGQPPKFIRAIVSNYTFAPMSQDGVWWKSENPQPYCPALTLNAEGQLSAMN